MLEKPDIQETQLLATLQTAYGIEAQKIEFLPLGADLNTAVYRAVASDGTPYFLKLRKGEFDELTVTIPKFLHDAGVGHLIAPLPTKTGALWATFEGFKVILFPFVEGKNGYEQQMTETQWRDLGVTFRQIHTLALPPALQAGLQQESYTPLWREQVQDFLAREDGDTFTDALVQELFAFVNAHRATIRHLVERAALLAEALQAEPLPFVLCHADIHAGNVLLGADGALYLVDWDTLLLAPKERDLMYFGASLWSSWHTPEEEETLFFRGYGEAEVNAMAVAYYRYERIVQDLAVSIEHILQTDANHEDRALSLYYFKSNFLPNSTIGRAEAADGESKA